MAPNLLGRQFGVAAPNRAWVTDITYVSTDEGWLYLAGLKDLFDGELVGYAMAERMTQPLVMKALFRAVAARRPGAADGRLTRWTPPLTTDLTVTVAGKPSVDVPPGTLNSVLKQAGLKR